jgi:hypothetical protein
MADKPVNPLVSFMDMVADVVDWIHDTFADPELSRSVREDLGIDPGRDLQRPLPSGENVRMRLPNGDPVDVDKDAFNATLAEVKETFRLLFDFFSDLGLSVDEVWDVVFMVSQVAAAESLRTRWPRAEALLRAGNFLGGIGSQEDVQAVDIVKALDLVGGKSNVPSDTTDPRLLEAMRNWVGVGTAILTAIYGDRFPVGVRASYGFDPEPNSGTPKSDSEARAVYSLEIFDDPAGASGVDANLTLTLVYLPGFTQNGVRTPYKLLVALGGGFKYTRGKLTAGIQSPEVSYLLTSPWKWDGFDIDKSSSAFVAYGRRDDKAIEWGQTDGPHLLVDVAQLRLELSSSSSIRAELKGVEASIALSDADSFISSLSQELKSTFDVALVFDENGLRLEGGPKSLGGPQPPRPAAPLLAAGPPGSAVVRALAASPSVGTTSGGLEASLPAKTTQFGPFRILGNRLALGRTVDGTPRTSIEISTSVSTALGPFKLAIDRIGMSATLRAGGAEPNLGLLDLDFGFKPPNGIGIAIDAKVVKGGGFLRLDTDKGEYAGVLELSFSGLSLKAVGIVNTKAPEPAGWSLLLLIFAEFRDSPFPLPLGFNLTAVGGIIGLQHEASVEQLRSALGTNVFDDILFPADPVKDAPRLIGRLRTVFPVKAGALTIGPTAEINWGQPAIVTARLAILAQFGGVFGGDFRFTRLTLLGTVRATAPPRTVDAPRLVDLTADVLGDYDVESGLLAIDARLRDSRLGGVEFSGSLIVRAGFGSQPAFAVAAGGFHPAFTDLPPALPARIDRLGLQWKIGSSVLLTLQAYAAVTASSWQLGARFTVVAELGPVDIDGQLSFDAIAYDDGRFAIAIEGHVRVRWRGHTLMSVTLHLVLDRNAEQVWHAAGSASFSILWWDKTVEFENSWGDAKPLPPARTVDAAAAVRAGLSQPGNWSAQLPRGGEALVTLAARNSGADAGLVLAHPLGTLTVTQRVAPLELRLDFLDGAPVAAGSVVRVGTVRVGPTIASTAPTQQLFPRARFQNLSESERLTQKSFEQFPAGIAITPPGIGNPSGTVTPFSFESIIVRPDGSAAPGTTGFPANHVFLHTRLSRAAHSPIRQRARLGADRTDLNVEVRQPPVTVADSRDLGSLPVLDDVVTRSATLARQVISAPGQLVVEAHEVLA